MNLRYELSKKILDGEKQRWQRHDQGISIHVSRLAHRALFGNLANAGYKAIFHQYRIYCIDDMGNTLHAKLLRKIINCCMTENDDGFRVSGMGSIKASYSHFGIKLNVDMNDSHPSEHENKPLIFIHTDDEY